LYTLVLFALCVCVVFATTPARLSAHTEAAQFAAWTAKYNKNYVTTEEHEQRFANFKATLKRIKSLNEHSQNGTFGLTKFADLTPHEFRSKYLMQTPLNKVKDVPKENLLVPKVKDVPAKFDWRPQGVVTPVKNQGQCGSCWAFSATENIESVWMLAKNIKVNDMPPLAPQQIVDCDSNDEGCNGGFPDGAYDYVKSAGGLEKESDYPYRAVDESCHFKQADVYAKISGHKYATTEGDEKTLQQNLVSTSPLSICVDAANWQDYSGGVMTGWDCCWFCMLDHCVQLVGYDSTGSSPYYIVRNSWGTDWGENGYIRVAMGSNACGITDYATTAIV